MRSNGRGTIFELNQQPSHGIRVYDPYQSTNLVQASLGATGLA
jgi:hypothetical protein